MKLAANRTQVDAFHTSLQAILENVFVPDCLLYSVASGTKFVIVVVSALNATFDCDYDYDYDLKKIITTLFGTTYNYDQPLQATNSIYHTLAR